MRILVLGGTSFVGRHIVDAALAGGHTVTLFNRGRSNTDVFPDVDRLVGDRSTGDYTALDDSRWDAVVDVSAYFPRQVQQASAALGDRGGRYLFISTGSVYSDTTSTLTTEDTVRFAPERGTEEITGPEVYGALKVACEDDVRSLHGDRATIVRPGIVAGPHDPTDRFTYWVRRAAAGGEVLAPGRTEQPVQVVDARDLGAFVVHLLEADTGGIYNAVGPAEPVTLADLISVCADAAGSTVSLVPVGESFLTEHDVELPLVLPADGSWDGAFARSHERARAAGLVHRPLAETAAATLAWDRDRGEPPLAVGPDAAAEARVLEAWRLRR